MPFYTKAALREQYQRTGYERQYKSASSILREAKERPSYNFFLSHSYLDAKEIVSLRDDISSMGFSVYVDWLEDTHLDRNKVTQATAEVLRGRMRQCDAMLYAFSTNSSVSRWMPWEAGYFDALKTRVAILPVFDVDPRNERFRGEEYLGLYPYVLKDPIASTRQDTLWVMLDQTTYVDASSWLKGSQPTKH